MSPWSSDGQEVAICLASIHGHGTPEKSGPLMDAVCLGEGIGGELVTDARFGCILHEPKGDSNV